MGPGPGIKDGHRLVWFEGHFHFTSIVACNWKNPIPPNWSVIPVPAVHREVWLLLGIWCPICRGDAHSAGRDFAPRYLCSAAGKDMRRRAGGRSCLHGNSWVPGWDSVHSGLLLPLLNLIWAKCPRQPPGKGRQAVPGKVVCEHEPHP